MQISRRSFAGGALSLAAVSSIPARAFAQASPRISAALRVIQAYGEEHRAYFNLPGMTLGLVTPDGQRTVLNFGYANRDAKTAITADTLFQVGSISLPRIS